MTEVIDVEVLPAETFRTRVRNAARTPAVVARTVGGVEDGRLADGRNRREACGRAGVEFRVEQRDFETDDELKEFVIGINTTGRRESMTVQVAAASTALILGEEKRRNGRWERNSIIQNSGLQGSAERESMRCVGLVLDVLGRDALRKVRDREMSLNAAYELAVQKRDDERLKLEELQRLEAEEADARAFVEQNAPDLAARVDGADLQSYSEAQVLWEKRNREEAARIAKEKREKAEAVERDRQILRDRYTSIAKVCLTASSWGGYAPDDFDEQAEAVISHMRTAGAATTGDLFPARAAGAA